MQLSIWFGASKEKDIPSCPPTQAVGCIIFFYRLWADKWPFKSDPFRLKDITVFLNHKNHKLASMFGFYSW